MTSPELPGSRPGAELEPDPAHALERALADIGIECSVEVQGKLALVLTADEAMARLADDATRRRTVDVARVMGFSHVAIELRAPPSASESLRAVPGHDAPFPRD